MQKSKEINLLFLQKSKEINLDITETIVSSTTKTPPLFTPKSGHSTNLIFLSFNMAFR